MKIRLIVFILAAFVLGNVSGAFVGARVQQERHEQRDKLDNLHDNIMALLAKELTLTQEQAVAVDELVGQACEEIRGVYERGADDIELIIRRYHDLIALRLTPEQDKIFKELEEERRQKNDRLVDDPLR